MLATPLTPWHRQHQAKMAEFGGYTMPIEYAGILQEHRAVRGDAGMFDVSHMGEIEVRGDGAAAFLDVVLTNPPSRLAVGRALYALLCQPDGGVLDDVVVLRLAPRRFWLVVNAANREADRQWLERWRADDSVTVADLSDTIGLIALQGPRSPQIAAQMTSSFPLSSLGRFGFALPVALDGVWALVSRTGYTGEAGFEIFLPAEATPAVWSGLVERGVPPIGLGARDTLRLEAGLMLYGNDLTPEVTPLEAGLQRFVRFEEHPDFIGRDALIKQARSNLSRKLVGIVLMGPGIARQGYRVGEQDRIAGRVTSGSYAPSLDRAVALALVAADCSAPGTELWVEIRDRRVPARVVSLPFYRSSD